MELLLKQVRADAVEKRLPELFARIRSLRALAECPANEIEKLLGPLGLQRQRAEQLSGAARVLVERHAGAVPGSLGELRRIPGIGEYVAHALMVFGFATRLPAIDVNGMRVVSRLMGVRAPTDLRRAKRVWAGAWELIPPGPRNTKRFNWAVLDLAAAICRPAPCCEDCPLRQDCRSAASSTPTR
ncbi:MAG: hypothetical protein JST92_24595 [Deltaproteobacteria bacterium]|nr:hypothetical protein [Deltaproteobacteria bacterium]